MKRKKDAVDYSEDIVRALRKKVDNDEPIVVSDDEDDDVVVVGSSMTPSNTSRTASASAASSYKSRRATPKVKRATATAAKQHAAAALGSSSRSSPSSTLTGLLPYLVKVEPPRAATAPLSGSASLTLASGSAPASSKTPVQPAASAAPTSSSSTSLLTENVDYDSLRPEDQDVFAQWVGYDGDGGDDDGDDEAPAHNDNSIASLSDEDDEDDPDGQKFIAKLGDVNQNRLLGYDQDPPPPPRLRITLQDALDFEAKLDAERGRPLGPHKQYSDEELVRAVLVLADIAAHTPTVTLQNRPTLPFWPTESKLPSSASKSASHTFHLLRTVASWQDSPRRQAVPLHRGSEVEETMLAAPSPPTRETLRQRALHSCAWRDRAWLAYSLLLFRPPSFRTGGYEGSAGSQRSTSPGGGTARGHSHLAAIAIGGSTAFYDMVRDYPGELAFYLGWRIDISALDRRYALLQAARIVLVHLVEAVRHELLGSFDS